MNKSLQKHFLFWCFFFTANLVLAQCTPPNIPISPAAVVEGFDDFTGTGFSPMPTTGQLCSNTFATSGWSDGAVVFGGTGTSGDFARGSTGGSVSAGGIYDNASVWFQPGGSDFTPGDFTYRLVNNTGGVLVDLLVSYDIFFLNDQGRSNSLNFSHSPDDITYTAEASLDFTTVEAAATTPVIEQTNRSITLSGVNIPDGAFYYLRWTGNDVSGGGSRDEYGLDNISVSGVSAMVMATCPTIGALSDPADVCEGEAFDLTVSGLANLEIANNGEQNYGIRIVAFTSPPADPYIGGMSLDTLPFGNLTAGNTMGTLSPVAGSTGLAAGTYSICAILDGTPADMTCRPSQCINLTVNAAPAGPGVMGTITFCEGETITPITAFTSPPGPMATFNFYSDAGLTMTSPGTINGADYTAALTAAGTEQVFITQTIDGCEGAPLGVTITVNPAPDAPTVANVSVCDGEDTTITPGAGGGGGGGTMVLLSEDFETDPGGNPLRYETSIPEFTDGFGDYFIRTDGSNINGNYTGANGNFFFGAQDIDGEGALPMQEVLLIANIAGFTGLNFSGLFAEDDDGTNQDWDDADFLHIDYIIDGGPIENLLWIEGMGGTNSEPAVDTNFDGVGDGTIITDVFQTLSAGISGTGSAIIIIITINLDSGDEDIAFDLLEITGTMTAPPAAGTFNFYNGDPTMGGVLLAGPVASFDPGTTLVTSPESVFVTTTNAFGCESQASEVVVTVNAAPAAPTFNGTTSFCAGEAITPITAIGDAGATFQFFADAALTMPAPGTVAGADYTTALTAAGTETVFITQTVMGCQGPATMVDIEILAAPAAPTFTGTVEFCDGEMITPITVMGAAGVTFTFYGDAALTTAAPGTVNGADYTAALTGPGMETVYFTQTNGMGCESTAGSATITISALPDPPMVMDIAVCDGGDTEIIPTAGGGGGGLMTVYLETFDTQFEGVSGPCPDMDPANCTNFTPPSNGQWSVTGDASGLTGGTDFFNVFGGVLNAQDTDSEICFLSQPIDISTLISADFSVSIAERGDHESDDYVDVTLIVDGTPMLISDWMGLGDATHTLIGDSPDDDDWISTTVMSSGITGSILEIQICVLNNAGSEDIDIDDIMVSGLSAGGPLYNFYDANPIPGPANLLAGMANTFDPMTTVATSSESVFVTVIDPISGCESEAVEVIVTVNPNPVLDIVATGVLGCPGDATGTVMVTSTTGTAPFSFVYSTTDGSGDDGDGDGIQTMLTVGTYTVVATDANGCTATADFTINDAVDGDAPIITCPLSPIEINCGESTLTSNTGIATATDVCTTNPVISFEDVLVLDGCGGRTGTLTRTFTATDEAGNASTCEQIINIVDNTPPTFTPPGDITIECTDDPNDLTITGMPTDLMDNCNASGIENIWINEFHYDNVGIDANEFIELAGTAGLNLTGFTFVLYNGSNGANYGALTLPGGVIPDEGNGFGAVSFLIPGIQNGAPDGIALVDPSGAVLEFISYEGSFTAVDGPAIGITSTDIGVSETGGTTATSSLQRIGNGTSGGDFLWSGPTDPSSPGVLNVNQTVTPVVFPVPTFTGFTDVTVGDPNCPNGSIITRTFTVTDACGNTATATQVITIEDSTAPVTPAAPGDLVVDCPQDIPDAPVLVASDACGGNIMSTVNSEIINRQCATRFTLVRTFTFDDGCGNTSSVTQNIEVTDPGSLTVEPLPDHIIDCEVNIQPQEFLVQATSPCGNPPTVTSVINGPFGELGCPGTFYNVVYTCLLYTSPSPRD